MTTTSDSKLTTSAERSDIAPFLPRSKWATVLCTVVILIGVTYIFRTYAQVFELGFEQYRAVPALAIVAALGAVLAGVLVGGAPGGVAAIAFAFGSWVLYGAKILF